MGFPGKVPGTSAFRGWELPQGERPMLRAVACAGLALLICVGAGLSQGEGKGGKGEGRRGKGKGNVHFGVVDKVEKSKEGYTIHLHRKDRESGKEHKETFHVGHEVKVSHGRREGGKEVEVKHLEKEL